MNIEEFRNEIRDYLKNLKGVVPAPPRYERRLSSGYHMRMAIVPDDIPPIDQKLRHALLELAKPRNPRRDLIAKGEELLGRLERQPELRGDESALREHLRVCAEVMQAVGKAHQAFVSVADDCIHTRLDALLGPDKEAIMRRIEEDRKDLYPPVCTSGYIMTTPRFDLYDRCLRIFKRTVAKMKERKMHLRWRELGETLFALPEFNACLDAHREAAETLCRRMAEFPLGPGPSMQELEGLPTHAGIAKMWEEFWRSRTETDEFVAWFDDLREVVVLAIGILYSPFTDFADTLDREFRRRPLSRYNHYYNPR